MLEADKRRTTQHLINLVLNRNNKVPEFALLLGSGASASSGVNTATELIDTWRDQLYVTSRSEDSFQTWLEKQGWYNSDDEYSVLFELIYDQPSQRRSFIEECLTSAHPSWGYVYLVSLMEATVFNVVLTTNFDDLINEACYLYSEKVRPLVLAHDSAVTGLRVTSQRPKIMKLHGDFLFDNIKNTLRELETLEDNMKKKFSQFAQEYGLVVAGYSGRDRSVMDILDALIRTEGYFRQGIYWCHRQGDPIGRSLRHLLRRDGVYLVEVAGFDQLMAEIHHAASLTIPAPLARPFDVFSERARLFVDIPADIKHNELIGKDVEQLLEVMGQIDTSLEMLKKIHDIDLTALTGGSLPTILKAMVRKEQGDLDGALELLKDAEGADPEDKAVSYELASLLVTLGRKEELRDFVLRAKGLADENKTYFLLHADDNKGTIDVADAVLASKPSSEIARINRAIALKRLGRSEDMERELRELELLQPNLSIRAGVAALRGRKEEMLALLAQAHNVHLISTNQMETFVLFEDYREDPDFLRFIEERRRPHGDVSRG